MSEILLHPIAVSMVVVLVVLIAFCAFTEKRNAKPFDPWEK